MKENEEEEEEEEEEEKEEEEKDEEEEEEKEPIDIEFTGQKADPYNDENAIDFSLSNVQDEDEEDIILAT